MNYKIITTNLELNSIVVEYNNVEYTISVPKQIYKEVKKTVTVNTMADVTQKDIEGIITNYLNDVDNMQKDAETQKALLENLV
jgi:hypothetical protein